MNIVTLCTGNVARSVMLGYMLTTLAESNGRRVDDPNGRYARDRRLRDEWANARRADEDRRTR